MKFYEYFQRHFLAKIVRTLRGKDVDFKKILLARNVVLIFFLKILIAIKQGQLELHTWLF